ncbi:D-aminoacyl-tRNA deacylase [Neolewinella sp.]|uniref:D-aminoacyl-tRNA deacylase n=1 Tax=Neolewinella sp. TaxID=2993543 RepID=UPI003B52D54C
MRILIQRVTKASVAVEGDMIGQIGSGLLILLGIESEDGPEDIDYLCGKLTRLRIFSDEEGKMNRSVVDIDGGLLVVSQFTLYASTKKGNRPGFTRSAPPAVAVPLYERFVARLGEVAGRDVATGEFGADMQVALVNDGPVTIWMDSRARE